MNTLTGNRGATRSWGSKPFLPLLVGVIITVSSSVLAQDAISRDQPHQSDASTTRQRRISSEDADTVILFKTKEEVLPRSSRRVFVRSTSLLVRAAVVEDKLLKRPEFQQLGFVITRDLSEADLILELRHDLFTKYVFSVIDAKTQLVLASGKLSSVGGTVAGKVAKRFV